MIDAEPQITVIIPTFRRPKLLRRAIVSVLNQSFSAFRICVYDNASNDDTQKVVAELAKTDSRISYYCHEHNIGAIKNFNYGLKAVTTSFFSFLSDDDFLLPDCFETLMRGFERHADAMFSMSQCVTFDGERLLYPKPFDFQSDRYLTPPESLFVTIGMTRATWKSAVFRKEVITLVGVLDEKVGPPCDLDFQLRIAAHYPCVMSLELLAVSTIYSTTLSSSFEYNEEWYNWWLQLMKNVVNDATLASEVRNKAKVLLRATIARFVAMAVVQLIKNGDYDTARNRIKILENCEYTTSLILKLALVLSKHFPPTRRLFKRSVHFYKAVYKLRVIDRYTKTAIRKNPKLQKQIYDYMELF